MKFSQNIIPLFLAALLILGGCDGEEGSLVNNRLDNNPIPDPPPASSGSADFSNFVTIGNSLTAGFMDAALYNLGQENSLGAQIAGQLVRAGAPDEFNQPDISSELGFNTAVTNPQNGLVLGRFKLDTSIPGPSPTLGGDPIGPFQGNTAQLDNFAVPGILVGQMLTPATGGPATPENPAFNPFYQRFASSPGNSTILAEVVIAQPSFFTLWLGNNDVLGFALSGATQDQLLTEPQVFQQQFGTVINILMTETQASGVVGTIPPILGIPFFRAVPYNAIELDQPTADQLNQAFTAFNQVLDGLVQFLGHPEADAERRKVSYQAGNNPVLIVDPDLEDLSPKFDQLLQAGIISAEERAALQPFVQSRPMEVNPQTGPELLLLTAGEVLGTLADPNNPQSQIGVVIPLQPQFHLTASNIIEIETARATFNAMISGTVQQANQSGVRLGLFDANAPDGAFADLLGLSDGEPGIVVSGTNLQPDFSPNGVFSTDGIHPNPRGTAILANEFIKVIEETFNAEIPEIEVLRTPTVQLCNGNCASQQGKIVPENPQRILPGNLFQE